MGHLQAKTDKAFCLLLLVLITRTALGVDEVTKDDDDDTHGHQDSLDWHDAVCSGFKGAYGRLPNLGIVCCGNDTLTIPLDVVHNIDSNPLLGDCALKFPKDKSSDMPAALWNVWSCVLKEATVFPDDKVTFKNYFDFVTDSYPEEIKKKLTTSTASCKKDADKVKSNEAKIQKFMECFYKSEEKVCHRPFAKSASAEKPKDTEKDKNECSGIEGIYGTARMDNCCKKQSLPFNFEEFFDKFPKTDEEYEQNQNCSDTFVARQQILDPKLAAELTLNEDPESDTEQEEDLYNNATEMLQHCSIGCELLQKNYVDVKDLSINYEKAASIMVKHFGEKIRKELEKVISNRKSGFSCYVAHTEDKSLNFDELTKNFKKGDEMMKIRYFCGFAECLLSEVQRDLHEYCHDKEYAKKWYENRIVV